MSTVYMDHTKQDRHHMSQVFGRPVENIHHRRWDTDSAFVFDLYDIESGTWNRKLCKRIAAHIQANPSSVVVLNLSHESINFVEGSVTSYSEFIEFWQRRIGTEHIVVMSSQSDIVPRLTEWFPGVAHCEVNFWEHVTACEIRRASHHPGATHRFSCLNRRYTPWRSRMIQALWPHRQHLYYSLGSGDPWGGEPDPHWQHQEWLDSGLSREIREHTQHWEITERPWRSLSGDQTELFGNSVWHAQARGAVSIVVESRVRTDYPRTSAFVTEKTFRPMAMGIPVIVLGQPATVATLRSWGYHTINDRSDPDSVYSLVQQLAALPEPQWQAQLKTWRKQAQANARRFRKRTQWRSTQSQAPDRLKQFFGA